MTAQKMVELWIGNEDGNDALVLNEPILIALGDHGQAEDWRKNGQFLVKLMACFGENVLEDIEEQGKGTIAHHYWI